MTLIWACHSCGSLLGHGGGRFFWGGGPPGGNAFQYIPGKSYCDRRTVLIRLDRSSGGLAFHLLALLAFCVHVPQSLLRFFCLAPSCADKTRGTQIEYSTGFLPVSGPSLRMCWRPDEPPSSGPALDAAGLCVIAVGKFRTGLCHQQHGPIGSGCCV